MTHLNIRPPEECKTYNVVHSLCGLIFTIPLNVLSISRVTGSTYIHNYIEGIKNNNEWHKNNEWCPECVHRFDEVKPLLDIKNTNLE